MFLKRGPLLFETNDLDRDRIPFRLLLTEREFERLLRIMDELGSGFFTNFGCGCIGRPFTKRSNFCCSTFPDFEGSLFMEIVVFPGEVG